MATERHVERTRHAVPMHVCPRCQAPFLQPADWHQAGPARWRVYRMCPNCEWSGDGVFAQADVDDFDMELDRGAEELLADLEALSRAAMSEYVEHFAAALDAGQILPEDF